VAKALGLDPGKHDTHASGQKQETGDLGAIPPLEYEKWSAEASRDLLTSFNDGIINKIPNARELEEMEIMVIRKSLERYKGNFKEVAADLGMPEGDLYFKMEKYNL